MHTGTVTRVILDRGFGFIRRGNGEADIFFHCKELAPGLEFNEQLLELPVTFDLAQSGDRWRAVNVAAVEE